MPSELKEDLQLLLDEVLSLRQSIIQQLQRTSTQAELNIQVAEQQESLQVLCSVLQELSASLEKHQLPDYNPLLEKIEGIMQSLDDKSNKLTELILQHDTKGQYFQLDEKINSLNNTLRFINKAIESQRKFLQTNFDWKMLATEMATMALITSMVVIVGIRYFPPDSL